MIIQLQENIEEHSYQEILDKIDGVGYKHNEISTQYGKYLVCIGKKDFDIRRIGSLAGIKDIHRVSDAYKLVSSKWKVGKTAVPISEDLAVGNGDFQIMAGPCSIEGEAQVRSTIQHLLENNIKIMRGGVYKPRSSPYSFRGLGIDGLKMWHEQTQEAGIKIVTEVMQVSQIESMLPYVDIFQVGARNSQNFNLLDALGEIDKPILLKRGMSGTIDELLQAAEYIFSNGNEKIILCERGIRTYEKAYRNTMDINAVILLKEKSHLPVVVDPSHGIGLRDHVSRLALAGVMAGADGVIMEVHHEPEKAFSDGQQTLNYQQSGRLIDAMHKTRELALTI